MNLEAVFDFQKLTAAQVWDAFSNTLTENKHFSTKDFKKILARLKRARAMSFDETFLGGEIFYSGVRNYEVSLLFVDSFLDNDIVAAQLIRDLIGKDPLFLPGCTMNHTQPGKTKKI